MSTIKSSDEHLTLNADGTSKDIKFQANGVEKASISSSGAFTSTTIDATKLTGNLPAISGASLTNLPAASQLDHSGTKKFEATASGVTLTGTAGTSPILELNNADTEDNDTGRESSLRFTGNRSGGEDVINAQISGHHDGSADDDKGMMLFYTNNGSGLSQQLKITNDGRGLSQFTAKAWAKLNGTGTPSFYDSHNCSSITDNATGSYTVNFTNNTANNNYAALGNAGTTGNPQGLRTVNVYSYSNSGVDFGIAYVDGTGQDVPLINIAIFGD